MGVFVITTFTNLNDERNAPHVQVFPRLKRLSPLNGFQFEAVDLRWGGAVSRFCACANWEFEDLHTPQVLGNAVNVPHVVAVVGRGTSSTVSLAQQESRMQALDPRNRQDD